MTAPTPKVDLKKALDVLDVAHVTDPRRTAPEKLRTILRQPFTS